MVPESIAPSLSAYKEFLITLLRDNTESAEKRVGEDRTTIFWFCAGHSVESDNGSVPELELHVVPEGSDDALMTLVTNESGERKRIGTLLDMDDMNI
ncbi:hypothetical protein HK100_011762 [Physocladia obscura]|uniref:Uncharacterized protein n=1 Tax=Physocladia obscura TaxID=109957 RepID=A0AAD5T2F9_9FUNG|nr:hypothetical protein HK100_011762 [Physocladia obscura]